MLKKLAALGVTVALVFSPMAAFAHLSRWYAQLEQRPTFQQAVLDCERRVRTPLSRPTSPSADERVPR